MDNIYMVFVGILHIKEYEETYPFVVGIYDDKALAIEEVENINGSLFII